MLTRRRGSFFLLAALAAVSCTPRAPTSDGLPAAQPATAAPGPETTPSGSSVPTREASPDPVTSAAPVLAGSSAEVFQCGTSKTCKTGREICCGEGPGAHCAKRHEKSDPFDVCTSKANLSVEQVAVCDESIDCGATDVCCNQFATSSARLRTCVGPTPDQSTPCDFGEACVPGSPCRLPGTQCVLGHCERVVTGKKCGASVCSPDQDCCGAPLSCVPKAQCSVSGARVQCASHGDCVAGEKCVLNGDRTECMRAGVAQTYALQGGANWVCQRDADCPKGCAFAPNPESGVAMRCSPSDAIPWLKGCVCP